MNRPRLDGTNDEAARFWLAAMLIVMIAGCLTALFFMRIPESNREMLSMVVGALLAKLTDVYGYHFGSSSGSTNKDSTIDTLARTAHTAGAALAPDVDVIPLAAGETAIEKADPETTP